MPEQETEAYVLVIIVPSHRIVREKFRKRFMVVDLCAYDLDNAMRQESVETQTQQ